MELQLLRLLSRFGYPGMFLLLTIESIFPPIPSEVVLTFGGFMTEHTSLTLTGMVIAATAGSTAGAMLLYLAGRLIPLERLERILSKRWIQKIGFKAEDLKKTLNWFDKHENTAVLIGRCVPVIRSLISIPAGMTRMPLAGFLIRMVIGSSVWNLLLLSLGKKAGSSWYQITAVFERYSIVIVTILLLALLLYVAYKQKGNAAR